MKIKVSKVDPVGSLEKLVETEVILITKYKRFLVEIDGVEYMLTPHDAYIINPQIEKDEDR
jgi:hypothetical protein